MDEEGGCFKFRPGEKRERRRRFRGLRMYVEFYENAEILSEPLRATNIILNLPCGPIRISKCLLPKKNERIS